MLINYIFYLLNLIDYRIPKLPFKLVACNVFIYFRQRFSNLCICIEPQLLNENSNLLCHFCNALKGLVSVCLKNGLVNADV